MWSLARSIIRLSVVGLGLACAHAPEQRGAQQRSSPNVITRAEMEASEYASLYDVVQALRGRWLRSRGPRTLIGRPAEVQVMVDDMHLGGVGTLRSLSRDNVVTIEFVDPVAAAQRWGGSHAQGTILVTTRADGAPDAGPKPR